MALLAAVLVLASVPALTQELDGGSPLLDEEAASEAWSTFEGAALLVEPIEVLLSDALRAQCVAFGFSPPPILLNAAELGRNGGLADLEGLAACVTQGALNGSELELTGVSELPGAVDYPVESTGPADVVRAVLGGLGVPFQRMTVSDVEQSPLGSAHAAARVSIGIRGELMQSSEETP